ncbi:GntR family transcriptional regulator [Crossiella sp. NPDC003009]
MPTATPLLTELLSARSIRATLARDGDKLSNICLYLLGEITQDAAGYRVGDRLPSAAELCEMWDCSKGTAQKALARLQDAGVIEGQQGRGNYVTFDVGAVAHHRERLVGLLREAIQAESARLLDALDRNDLSATMDIASGSLPALVEDYAAATVNGDLSLAWQHREAFDREHRES